MFRTGNFSTIRLQVELNRKRGIKQCLAIDIDDTILRNQWYCSTYWWFVGRGFYDRMRGRSKMSTLEYWERNYVGCGSVYPSKGATEFLTYLNEKDIPVYLVTARRMHMRVKTMEDIKCAFPKLKLTYGPNCTSVPSCQNKGIYFTEQKDAIVEMLQKEHDYHIVFIDDYMHHVRSVADVENTTSFLFTG